MTPDECALMKQTVTAELKQHQIKVYEFPEAIASLGGSVDEKSFNEVKSWCKRQPFAVVSSDRWIEHADGKKVRGRAYPWGVVETENLAHNDFTALKNLLLNVHLQVRVR
ncbi:Protein peanut [Fasciola gigantica]|uniref:Protein peanut n=1 Tax=Fasciola gigantica TaxID=46835 RepID=A0A504Z320_FASGI|nr:Protein peanut [Fasciola gigantica]